MILQTLLSVAFIAVIAAAIMTSALANAKVAAHQAASRIATAALARGTDEFVNWAQIYVAKHGAATTWPTTRIVDQPVAACDNLPSGTNCDSYLTITYTPVSFSANQSSGPDPVANLQQTIHENRLSGVIVSSLTTAAGGISATQARVINIRILDAPPFAILAGSRDSTTAAASQSSNQGDTGGYKSLANFDHDQTPSPSNPSAEKDTTIPVKMACANSYANSNASKPGIDDRAPGNDSLPWGASGGTAFEAPCAPTYTFSRTPTTPPDASLPDGNVYDISVFDSKSWTSSTPAGNGSLP